MVFVPPPVPPAGSTSISQAGADFNQTVRIDQVFQQLLSLLQVLQSVAVVQSQRLNFLSSWQQAYNALMKQVPVFTAASSIFGGTSTEEINTRDEVNRINSSYLEQLRSANSMLGDQAKSMQSQVTQTNDMVTQVGNMATAFLQELTTIVSTIFR